MTPTTLDLPHNALTWEELSTETEHGFDRHTVYKNQSQILAQIIRYLKKPALAKRIDECNSYKEFEACLADLGHPKRVVAANYCKDRFCATCQWLKSRKAFDEAMLIGHHILADDPKLRFIFLTLTVPNVPLSQLGDCITAKMTGWKRLIERKRVKDAILGYHRSLEVSYNPIRNDYHPHFHVLFVVPASYFGKRYINQAEWLSLWQSCMRDESITQVDVRAVKAKEMTPEQEAEFLDRLECDSEKTREESRKMIKMAGAFAESCKYGVKEWSLSKKGKDGKRKGAILTLKEERVIRRALMERKLTFGLPGHIWIREDVKESAKALKPLRSALRHRRLIQPGGIIAEVRRDLKLPKDENQIGCEEGNENKVCRVCGCDIGIRTAVWRNFYNRYTGEIMPWGRYLVEA